VYKALEDKGLKLKKQVGVCGYRIDIAVIDQNHPGRYILGIECDGAMYHSSATARDRDRLRQSVLEDLGWRIHRVWSQDWFRNPIKEIEKILAILEDTQKNSPSPNICKDTMGKKTEPKKSLTKIEPKKVNKSKKFDEIIIPGTVYYETTDVGRMGMGADSFYYTPYSSIIDVVVKVVEREGPVHVDVVKKRVANAWNIKRIGSKIDMALDWTINFALSKGLITKKTENFLWSINMNEPVVRIPKRGGEKRRIEEISLDEIAAAAYLCIKNALSLNTDDVITETARLFGINVNESTRSRIVTGIRLLEKGNKIHWHGQKIRLTQP
jgi:very-short-patch-repair endonuclease